MANATRKLSEGWETRIVRDPKICGGEPTFRGTRVLLRTVLGGLAAGDSPQDILEAPKPQSRGHKGSHHVCCSLRGGRFALRNAPRMKIKLDENLPPVLATELRGLGHEVDTVADEGLLGSEDEFLWPAVQAGQRFLITQDLDFSDARKYRAGIHFGILVLRLGDLKMIEIIDRVKAIFEAETVEQWASCCVIATEWKVRVTRPDAR